MGSFWVKCAISGITIEDKQDCVLCLVKKTMEYESKDNFARLVFPLVFGKYDDYGRLTPSNIDYNKKISEYFEKHLKYSLSEFREDALYKVAYVDKFVWDNFVGDSYLRECNYRVQQFCTYDHHYKSEKFYKGDALKYRYERPSYILNDIEKYKKDLELNEVPYPYSKWDNLEKYKANCLCNIQLNEKKLSETPCEEFFNFLEDVFNDESLEDMFKEINTKSFIYQFNLNHKTTQIDYRDEQIKEFELLIQRLKQLKKI